MPLSSRSARRARRLLALVLAATLAPLSTAAGAEPGVAVATDQVMAGLYAPQQWYSAQHIRAVNEASGKKVAFGGLWFNVAEPASNVIYMLEEIWSVGATPFVNIHINASAADIANGTMDTQIASMGSAVNQWLGRGGGRSVLLAPMPEMNGDWIPYGMDPINFKNAYRRFVTTASRNGSSGWRVRWVFAPNGWSAPPHHMADYYPGADVVDLVGISAYNWGSNEPGLRWTTVYETMGGALDEARGFAPEKPFLVAQTASSPYGGDRDAWIREMFDFLADDPNAVGFLYFNIEKEHDWTIYKGNQVAAGWRDGMASDRTVYQFPLDDWFTVGPLVVDSWNEPYQGRFADDDASQFQADIEWLANWGITTGCAPNRFCPTSAVSRGEMASFLVRSLGLPYASLDFFVDDDGSIHEADINAIAQAGITSGCGGSAYCPGSSVTREQMATFLTRGFAFEPASVDYFWDDNSSAHQGNINSLALAGVTTGCGAGVYCPEATVTREQMAGFLHRALE